MLAQFRQALRSNGSTIIQDFAGATALVLMLVAALHLPGAL